MAYHDRLEAAITWLEGAQRRRDGGWGLAAGQASSIVNTAEALFVLRRGRFYPPSARHGIEFIRSNLPKHLDDPDRGRRVRYVAFALLAFAEYRDFVDKAEIESCVSWLLDSRNHYNGWGHEARDASSQLFPTAIAMWALRKADATGTTIRQSQAFVISLAREDGWRLQPDMASTPVANAFGLLALGESYARHPTVVTARSALLQTSHWGCVQEPVPGSLWSHSTFAWVLPELARFTESPFQPVIAEGIRYVNALATPNGWGESPGQGDVTVRSQFWATMALSAIYNAFDPARDLLRIDATRAQESLPESEFVKMVMHTSWATVVPAKVYRLFVWLLLVGALTVLWGGHRLMEQLPRRADAALSIVPALLALLLIKRRPKQFRWLAPLLGGVLLVLEAVHLILGISVAEILHMVQPLPGKLKGWWQ